MPVHLPSPSTSSRFTRTPTIRCSSWRTSSRWWPRETPPSATRRPSSYSPNGASISQRRLKPKPLYRAYELLAKLLATGGDRFALEGALDGKFEGGQGAALAVRDPSGKLRVLVVNRGAAPRTVRVVLDGAPARAATVSSFDDPGGAVHALPSASIVTLAPRSISLLEM